MKMGMREPFVKKNSQGEDPRTFEENRDLSTPENKEPGKGPKNLWRTSGKVSSSEKTKGQKV